MGITPEYTKKAVNNYRNKFDLIQVRFPKGTKEIINNTITDVSMNEYITCLVMEDLKKRNTSAVAQPKTEQTIAQPVKEEKPEPKENINNVSQSWDDLPFH